MEGFAINTRRISMIHYTTTPVVGGVEYTIDSHARILHDHGFKVDLIAGRGKSPHPDICYHNIPEMDTQHEDVKAMDAFLAKGKVPHTFTKLRDRLDQSLRPLLVAADVNIVHNAITLHFNLALTAALHKIAREENVTLVSWSHDLAWNDKRYRGSLHPGYPWDLLRNPWPRVQYVSVSTQDKIWLAELLDIPEEAIKVIHPGVEVSNFLDLQPLTEELVERFQLLKAEPLMLLPARIVRRKNIEFGIHITDSLMRHFPRATLIITGPPDPHSQDKQTYLKELMYLRNELNMENRVLFLCPEFYPGQNSPLPSAVVAELFRLADLLLFPSRHEAFGLPLLEAGLARLPVFTAEVPDSKLASGQMIHQFAIDSNPSEVADRIAHFLKNDSVFALHRTVLKCFTWPDILQKKLLPFLESLLSKKEYYQGIS
jgi:glycosyltransferase involved in cell wall biosynthesis